MTPPPTRPLTRLSASAESAYHPCGTVRMGRRMTRWPCRSALPGDRVDGLRVADPRSSADHQRNLNAPSIMTGEKAADHILGRAPLARANDAPFFHPDWQATAVKHLVRALPPCHRERGKYRKAPACSGREEYHENLRRCCRQAGKPLEIMEVDLDGPRAGGCLSRSWPPESATRTPSCCRVPTRKGCFRPFWA